MIDRLTIVIRRSDLWRVHARGGIAGAGGAKPIHYWHARFAGVSAVLALVLVGCTSNTSSQAVPITTSAPGHGWPAPNSIGLAPSPALTGRLNGWTLVEGWDSPVRAFDASWSPATSSGKNGDYGFPNTMNGCDSTLFLIRWRAVTDGRQVTAGFVQADTGVAFCTDDAARNNMPTPKAGDTVTGAAGWMSLDGCQAPLFQFNPALTRAR